MGIVHNGQIPGDDNAAPESDVKDEAGGATLASLTPNEILRKMALAYATVSSYSDSGEVIQYIASKYKVNTTRFKTYFVRPDRFRFDWEMGGTSYMRDVTFPSIIWYDGKLSRTFHTYGVRTDENVQRSIGAAVGVSCGASVTVYERLMPPASSKWELVHNRPQFTDVEGVKCIVIQLRQGRLARTDLAIGIADFLIRRRTETIFGLFKSVETRREIVLNNLLRQNPLFHMKPPRKATPR